MIRITAVLLLVVLCGCGRTARPAKATVENWSSFTVLMLLRPAAPEGVAYKTAMVQYGECASVITPGDCVWDIYLYVDEAQNHYVPDVSVPGGQELVVMYDGTQVLFATRPFTWF